MTINKNINTNDYKICKNCIMDTSDPHIEFDSYGFCNHCNNFKDILKPNWNTDEKGKTVLENLVKKIQNNNKSEFDCIIGLSGGLDSSFTAHLAVKELGLKPLLFHVDAGWNTDQAVGNIEKLVDGLGLDLYTEVINWDQMRRLQLAFLRSGIPDQDLVQDAAFFSALYKFAKMHKVRHVFTGSNFSTECCREPEEWGGYLGIDNRLFRDIWSKHGEGRLENFPLIDILTYKVWYLKILGMKIHHPLNHFPYIKKDAENLLESMYEWKPFKHKHHESRFTRFFEDYWLPKRFGYEKRRAHFSSLIMTHQMSREEALTRISSPEMSEKFLAQEFEYVAHKLGISISELETIFNSHKKTFKDYKNKRWLIRLGAQILRYLGPEKRFFR